MRATTPMSCVTSTMAMPSRARRSASRSRICAWMVTSSAVVGSSASSRAGSHSSARAMPTRWRMPPDSSCGNCFSRASGSPMPTRRSSSPARSSAARRPSPVCQRRISVSWRPMDSTGFSEVAGFWKIIAMRRPRMAASRAGGAASRSSPSNTMRPAVIRAGGGCKRSRLRLVTVLPLPLSPTMPSVSPGRTWKSTPSTARTAPSRVGNSTRSPSTRSRASATADTRD